MSVLSYKTLMKRDADEIVINKSRFIGYGTPCETEEEARAFLAGIRERHRDASHNCYAYILGANEGVMRYSDDGEPGGTAGMPILGVLRKRGVVNACVVVTRYFGGVLLGAGGLVRAYAQTAGLALDACGVGVMEWTHRALAEVEYAWYDRLVYALGFLPAIVEDTTFAERVTLTLLVRDRDWESVSRQLVAATEGRVEALALEAFYHPWEA